MTLFRQEIHDTFHLEFGRLVHAYAQLDFAVGIALDWLGPHNGEDVQGLLVGRVPLAQRLDKLKFLVRKTYQAAGQDALAEFEAWFTRACELKAIRNDYVHARWHVPDFSPSDDPVVMMMPLNWQWTPANQPETQAMALSTLAAQVIELKKMSKQFDNLTKRDAATASPASSCQ